MTSILSKIGLCNMVKTQNKSLFLKFRAFSKLREVWEETMKAVVHVEGRGEIKGSGMLVSDTGYIFTCEHVISDPCSYPIIVSSPHFQSTEAKIVHKNEKNDVALLKVDSMNNLPFVKLASSKHLQYGEDVSIMGLPPSGLGYPNITLTRGTYCGYSANPTTLHTTCMGAPGFSGGPLISLHGVIGMILGVLNNDAGVSRNDGGSFLTIARASEINVRLLKDYMDEEIAQEMVKKVYFERDYRRNK